MRSILKIATRKKCSAKPIYTRLPSFFIFVFALFFVSQISMAANITVQDGKSLTVRNGGQITGSMEMQSGSQLIPADGAGCISLENLTLDNGSTLAVELGGTTVCTLYDQMVITDAIAISDATLSLTAINSFLASDSDEFVIVKNDGAGAVNGTFSGLTEGNTTSVAGKDVKISYIGGDGNDITLTVDAGKTDQTIENFNTIADKTYGDAVFQVSATATSGLTVTFTSTTPSVCTVSGTSVSLVSIGTCTVQASQDGNATYNSALDVSQSFTVSEKTLTVSGLSAQDKPWSGNTSATLSGIALLNGVVGSDDVSLSGTPTGTFSDANVGNNKTVTISGLSLSGTDAGKYILGTINTTASITKATQTITFTATLNSKTYGDADFSISPAPTASSGLAVSLASSTPAVCSVSGTTVSISGAGTCTITASQSGNANYNAAPNVDRSFSIASITLTVTGLSAEDRAYDGTTDATIIGTASLNGVIGGDSVSLAGTAVGTFSDTNIGTHTVTIGGLSLTGADAANYSLSSSITTTASITKADQTITFGALGDKIYGDTDFFINATASSNLTVSFTHDTPAVCTVSGNTVSLVAPGLCSISASQGGNSSYNAAVDVSRSFNVDATVTPSTGEGGTITPSVPQTVGYNNTVQFDIIPDARFTVVTPIGGNCGGAFSAPTYTTANITTDCTVEATFETINPMLTVTIIGSEYGTVTSDVGTLDCPGTCSDIYNNGDSVTLTAVPEAPSSFIGWSGDPECGIDGVVTLGSKDAECTATFYRFQWHLFLPAIIYNITTQQAP